MSILFAVVRKAEPFVLWDDLGWGWKYTSESTGGWEEATLATDGSQVSEGGVRREGHYGTYGEPENLTCNYL